MGTVVAVLAALLARDALRAYLARYQRPGLPTWQYRAHRKARTFLGIH